MSTESFEAFQKLPQSLDGDLFLTIHDFFSTPEKKKKTIRERARDKLLQMSKKIRDPHRRSEEILKIFDPVFYKISQKNVLPCEIIEEMRLRIDRCAGIKDVNQFVDRVMSELEPVFSLSKETIEEVQTDVMIEQGGFVPLNRLMSYGTTGSEIHIHASFGESVEGKLALYRDGMRKLAAIVNGDPNIQEITATSWIVAEYPNIFTRWGFDVKNISLKERKQLFGDDHRKVQRATISREEFLTKFLKNN